MIEYPCNCGATIGMYKYTSGACRGVVVLIRMMREKD